MKIDCKREMSGTRFPSGIRKNGEHYTCIYRKIIFAAWRGGGKDRKEKKTLPTPCCCKSRGWGLEQQLCNDIHGIARLFLVTSTFC